MNKSNNIDKNVMERSLRKNQRVKICRVSCPLCGSSQKKLLYDKMTDVEDKMPGSYTISQCLRCNLIYLSTRPSLTSLIDCYRNDYHVYVETKRSRFSKYLYQLKYKHDFRLLTKIVDHIPNSLIDIGFGSGGFLFEIRRRWGSRCQLAGVELERPLSDELIRSNVQLYIGVFEKLRPAKKYEIVLMNEILEHVYDPVQALRSAGRWLVKGGMLIGEVPDFNSPWRKVFLKYWQGFQIPRHMTFFDNNILKKVLDSAGFQMVSIGNRINYGDIGVSLCNMIINSVNPSARPRSSWLYIPLLVITAPIVFIMDKIFHTPGILEFVALKKSSRNPSF